jgi:beta-galactosidase
LWHGGDYYPEQWPREVWAEDARLMERANVTVATVGVFAWAQLEPEEGRYEFDWLDEALDRLTERDRWFILATPSAAPPNWLPRRYPEVLRTGPDRVRRRPGNRVNYSLASPIYREKTREIARRLAERYGNHPRLLAWHLSNEYGGADYGPESIAAFRQWLRRKFHDDLDALNAAYWSAFWSHTFRDWEEIDAPGDPYGEISMPGLTVDWRRFVTDQTIEFMTNEAAPLRELSPHVPITTNLMGLDPRTDYRKLAPHLDFVSWDSYPGARMRLSDPDTWVSTAFAHDLMRSLKPDRPWLLMECSPSSGNWFDRMALKRPGVHRFESLQAVAHGADGVLYFQWRQSRGGSEQFHGAVVGHAGDERTRVFQEVRAVGAELDELRGVAGTVTRAEVAIVFDWEARWALDTASGPVRGEKGYEATCLAHYRVFWEAGIPVDLIGLDDPLDRYRVVIAPMTYSLRPGFAERVEAFVESGGTFVATYLTGWTDENSLVSREGFLGSLQRVLGIWSEELDVLYPDELNHVEVDAPALGFHGRFRAVEFCELVHPTTAEVVGTYADDFYAGRPALTVNRVGEGSAWYVASRNEAEFTEAFLLGLADAAEVARATEDPLPAGVTAQRRGDVVFLMNAGSEPATVDGVVVPPRGVVVRDRVVASNSGKNPMVAPAHLRLPS